MITPRQQASPRGRADSRRVEVGVAQAVVGQLIQIRGLNRASIATQLALTCIINNDVDDIWGTLRRFGSIWPPSLRIFECLADFTFELLRHDLSPIF